MMKALQLDLQARASLSGRRVGGVGSGLEFTQLWRGLHPGKSKWSGPRDIGDPPPFSGDPEKGMADSAMVPHRGGGGELIF